jgi:diguanylate cyclase
MIQPRYSPDLIERIEHRRAQCRRLRAPLALLRIELLDLAGWRQRCGDALVRALLGEMGQRLRRRVRDTDEVLSHDDAFALLLPGAGSAEAAIVRRRLEAALTAPYRLGLQMVTPEIQISEQLWPSDAPTLLSRPAAAEADL